MPLPPVLAGANEKIFFALCEEFAKRGHEVTMISRRYKDFPHDEMINGVRFLRVPSRNRPGNKLLFRIFDILYAWRVRQALPEADVTITNSVAAPLILSKRTAGKIYVDVARYPKHQMWIYRGVDRLQCCSTHIARAVIEQTPSVAHLVKAIPNAFTNNFAGETTVPVDHDRPKEIVFVGRLAREKGVHLLIQAFSQIAARHPDWRVVVVGPHLESQGGDGEAFLTELKAMASQSGAAIDFVGPIFDDDELMARFRRSAIFVYPSVAEKGEAFPVAPLEAMACGCAPVVSDLRCFDDSITPGVHGLNFDHRDPSGKPLADVLERLIEDEPLRRRFAEASKEKSRNYVPKVVAQQFLEDFEDLTGLPVDGDRPAANAAASVSEPAAREAAETD
jgi:glycosyltransferase involved in cell wall biosynthesis